MKERLFRRQLSTLKSRASTLERENALLRVGLEYMANSDVELVASTARGWLEAAHRRRQGDTA